MPRFRTSTGRPGTLSRRSSRAVNSCEPSRALNVIAWVREPDAIQAHADAVLDALSEAGAPAYAELATPRRGRATVAAADPA